jgi:hypothetical protein
MALNLKNLVNESFYVHTFAFGPGTYETRVTELGEWTSDGQGQRVRDVGDDVWTRETMSEQDALAAHGEALTRARTRNFDSPLEVAL